MKYLLSLAIFIVSGISFNSENGFEKYHFTIPNSAEVISMAPIPGGKFRMGNNAVESESPEHEAEVSDFWMSVYEITWQEYELFVFSENKANHFQSPEKLRELGIDGISSATTPYTDMSFGMGKDGYPVVNVTQYAALSFCKWLSALTGDFYRLPTEAEWEYAARAGSSGAHFFAAGESLNDYAWHKGNSHSNYHPVGQKQPNAFGLYDILGNASEWTMDAFASYEKKIIKDFWKKPESLYPRVVRGGSWTDDKEKVTVTVRIASKPSWKIRDPQLPKSKWWHTNAPFVGFRIVRPRVKPSPEEIKKFWLTPIEDYN